MYSVSVRLLMFFVRSDVIINKRKLFFIFDDNLLKIRNRNDLEGDTSKLFFCQSQGSLEEMPVCRLRKPSEVFDIRYHVKGKGSLESISISQNIVLNRVM